MLVIRRALALRRRPEPDDRGAVLVTVLIVMLVGFIVVASIAASVVFTIGANQGNKGRTAAFVAAESGRDAAVAAVAQGACAISGTGADPAYSFRLKSTSGSQPESFDDPALVSACPTIDSRFVAIESTGTGPDGATAVVTTVYTWQVFYPGQPGGTMAYFDGAFTATQSQYKGDLVMRTGSYECNAQSTITGDLWLTNGDFTVSAKCVIDGSVYVRGNANLGNGADVSITGDVVAGGSISMTSNKAIVGGSLTANGGITTTAGKASGDATAGGTAAITPGTVAGTVTSNAGTPAVFNPTLEKVFDMTRWLDVPVDRATWGSDVLWVDGPCNGADVMPRLNQLIPPPDVRVGIDYTACTGPVTIKLSGGQVKHDVLFLVPPTSTMSIVISGSLTSVLVPQPQLFFIHGDAVLGNDAPDCITGSSTDSLSLPSITQVRMMLYSPCGLGSVSHINFNGQFYSNYDGNEKWVHPDFTCQNMAWEPILGLGCSVKDAAEDETPPPPPTQQLGPLITQRER